MTAGGPPAPPVGTCCLVLHSHLPWLAGHGTWPVGEEWLYQAWARSYLPLVDLLERLAGQGARDLLSLGVTPVLAAQLDDPGMLRGFHTWLGDWQVRAQGLAIRQPGVVREAAGREHRAATDALARFESGWRVGGSVPLRGLADAGVVELLGGPATHPFLPALDPAWARFALQVGLDDAAVRFGRRPSGVWPPECGYAPGVEDLYAAAGVGHVVLDAVSLPAGADPLAGGRPLGGSDVVAFAHDWPLVQLVWSPEHGYPGNAWYRDFHAFEPTTGLPVQRVTGPGLPAEAKQPYDPDAAAAQLERDADHFVAAVRRRLADHRELTGRPGVAVVAFDTELFGHWWHEGPGFLEQVLRRLPDAGVRPASLATVAAEGRLADPVTARAGTWGADHDDHVWVGPAVADLAADQRSLQQDVSVALRRHRSPADGRRPDLDQLARQTLLALASDWPFLVSHDQAADYARGRLAGHRDAARTLLQSLAADDGSAAAVAAAQQRVDRPFGHLDARLLDVGREHGPG